MTINVFKQPVLKGAIVGIGGYGLQHLRSLRQLQEGNRIKLCAAAHTGADNEQITARELEGQGCALYLTIEEMLGDWGDRLDFCSLPTSICSHVPLALQCIERGIHCLVEKPLTGDPGHLEQLEEAMRRHPEVLVTVGFQSLFMPEIISTRKRLREGFVGKIQRIKVFGAWPRAHSYYARNNWAGCIRTGEGAVFDSPLNNAMAHYLNLGLYWATAHTGEPARVDSVEGALYRVQKIENFDTASCRFNLDCGIPVSTWVTHSSERQLDISIIVEGENGRFEWKPDTVLKWKRDGYSSTVENTPREDGRSFMFNDFIDTLGGDERPQCRNVSQAAAHVCAIQKLQAGLSVQDVHPSMVEHVEVEGKQRTYIKGVDDLLWDGFQNNKLVTLPTV